MRHSRPFDRRMTTTTQQWLRPRSRSKSRSESSYLKRGTLTTTFEDFLELSYIVLLLLRTEDEVRGSFFPTTMYYYNHHTATLCVVVHPAMVYRHTTVVVWHHFLMVYYEVTILVAMSFSPFCQVLQKLYRAFAVLLPAAILTPPSIHIFCRVYICLY